jgi:hypothetical protein
VLSVGFGCCSRSNRKPWKPNSHSSRVADRSTESTRTGKSPTRPNNHTHSRKHIPPDSRPWHGPQPHTLHRIRPNLLGGRRGATHLRIAVSWRRPEGQAASGATALGGGEASGCGASEASRGQQAAAHPRITAVAGGPSDAAVRWGGTAATGGSAAHREQGSVTGRLQLAMPQVGPLLICESSGHLHK